MEIDLLVNQYGMAVLGLVMLIVIWRMMISPTLSVLKEIVDGQQAHGNILNTIVIRLENLEKKHDERKDRIEYRALRHDARESAGD